jgi:hypothetical protein
MRSRPSLTIVAGMAAALAFSACMTPYSETFAYKKNSFVPPVEKVPDIKIPLIPPGIEGGAAPAGAMPAPGAMPGVPGPDAGIPGLPGAAPAPAAPGIPAVPGL